MRDVFGFGGVSVTKCENLHSKKTEMSRNPRRTGGKDSQEDQPRVEKCPVQSCSIYKLVGKIMRGEKGITIGKDELNHLNHFHYRTWADFGWACSAAYKDDNDKLTEENAKLLSELSKVKPAVSTEPPVADPQNHVDGFCDALTMHPSGIVFKCTEYCKYGSTRCGSHQKCQYALEKI